MLQSYDIIGIQESKTDDVDNVSVQGFRLVLNNRKTLSRYRSGGIALMVKENIYDYIKIDSLQCSKLIQWFTISSEITLCNEDVHCGIIYVPPISSKYAHDDPFLELQEELLRYCPSSKYIVLMGDLNARTGVKEDYCNIDSHICNKYGCTQLIDESAEIMGYFERSQVPLARVNSDLNVNVYGNQLINFCKNTDLFILNGRLGDDNKKFTCKDKSVVDYFLSTANMFSYLQNFSIFEFSNLYSDAHCALSINLNVNFKNDHSKISTEAVNTVKTKLWNTDKADQFVQNIDIDAVTIIDKKLDMLLETDEISQSDVDCVVNDIGNIFKDSATISFGTTKRNFKKVKNKNERPWFNRECRVARNVYHNTRRLYNRYKSEHNKNLLKTVSKNYKRTISKSIKSYDNARINKLRDLRSSNPKEYWKILNSSDRRQRSEACLDDLYSFFKSINEENPYDDSEFNTDSDQTDNEIINQPISENEILKAISKICNNKSSGLDDIKNEHIKTTSHIMLPVYKKLFNIIFSKGLIPESWSYGTIKPIFKGKGDPKLAENYRPITILSCFGKLFTQIINDRLKEFSENFNLIEDCQAGFRRNFSTADNLFIINSLVDIAKASKNKLYCCFVDFKQAFDRVWRKGLWEKLLQYNINGKCYTIIRNMYRNIKSNVAINNESSIFFQCLNGVRQGENLSPFLFSIYLNDLQNFLFTNGANGVICDINYEEISVYLKLLVLLYADDTVLFANSVTDMQTALNIFENYCNTWKLSVNVSKTKIIVFTNGKISDKIHFTYGSQELEISNEYKYLGIVLSKSGSFLAAKKNIAEQANKALFSLMRKIRTLKLPIDIQLELFDKTIKPILLYGSEIWGFGNCEIIERVHLKFLKYVFHLKKCTPSHMIYGDLGLFPITLEINSRAISFWCKLLDCQDKYRLSSIVYTIVHSMHENRHVKSKWIDNVKHLICSMGFSGVWFSQSYINSKWFINSIKQKLKDVYIQKWHSLLDVSSGSNNYRLLKESFESSAYWKILPANMCRNLFAFRSRNHRFPVEVGRWTGQPLSERKCNFCKTELGDEFHFLLVCKYFQEDRKRYINKFYYERPNILKYRELMNKTNVSELEKLCKFVDILLKSAVSTG